MSSLPTRSLPRRLPAIAATLSVALSLACDVPSPSPVASSPEAVSVETNAAVKAAAAPLGEFRTQPAADSERDITVTLGNAVTLSGGLFRPARPEDTLKLEIEWGDGMRGVSACGPCRLSHIYEKAGRHELTATVHDRRFMDHSSVTQVFFVDVRDPLAAAPPTSAAPVPTSSAPGQYCHAITAYTGLAGGSAIASACPTAATQFCDTVPIAATSASQAKAACDACYGAGTCVASTFGRPGGAVYVRPGRATFVYQSTTAPVFCVRTGNSPYTPQEGEILDNAGCPLTPASRWAP